MFATEAWVSGIAGMQPAGRHRPRAGAVRRELKRHRREAAQEVAHQVRLGVDRGGRVEGVREPVGLRRAGG
jgi:hypothetical protein